MVTINCYIGILKYWERTDRQTDCFLNLWSHPIKKPSTIQDKVMLNTFVMSHSILSRETI